VTLCDAGPLFALIDPRQADLHAQCKDALATLPAPLVTTWPCFTEAMYLAFRTGGWPMQHLLWEFVRTGVLQIHLADRSEMERMAVLMEQYSDTPMDLADASLVAAAEVLDRSRIFTFDRHFYAYRLVGDRAFEVIP
jgi:predicted nucleic acid-binding protein